MERLIRALDLPVHKVLPNGKPALRVGTGSLVSHDEAVTALLYRWANPHTLTKVHQDLGMRPSLVSEVCSALVDVIYDSWYVRLLATDLRHYTRDFPGFAHAIATATNHVGFWAPSNVAFLHANAISRRRERSEKQRRYNVGCHVTAVRRQAR